MGTSNSECILPDVLHSPNKNIHQILPKTLSKKKLYQSFLDSEDSSSIDIKIEHPEFLNKPIGIEDESNEEILPYSFHEDENNRSPPITFCNAIINADEQIELITQIKSRTNKRSVLSYNCLHCRRIFRSLLFLKRHEIEHVAEKRKQIICKTCSMTFGNMNELLKHMKFHATYTCRYFHCKEVFQSTSLRSKHERQHIGNVTIIQTKQDHGKVKSSKISNRIKNNIVIVQNEKVLRTKKITNLIQVSAKRPRKPVSKMICISKTRAVKIKPLAKNIVTKSKSERKPSKTNINRKPKRKLKVFETKAKEIRLKNRKIRNTETDKIEQPKKQNETKIRKEKVASNTLKPFQCENCGKTFGNQSHLIQHTRLHTGEKKYKCRHCEVRFGDTTQGTRHEVQVHNKNPQKFKITTEVNTSVTFKKFFCTLCDKKFGKQSHLTQHIRVHTGETRFQCRFCEIKFVDTTQRSRHEYAQHKGGVKRYKCDECEVSVETPAALIVHKRKHTGEKPFICEECEKKFSQKSHLVSHKRIHTGVKPYECDKCSAKFADTTQRKRHYRIVHTCEIIERPYLCDECGKKFIHAGALQEHSHSHTGEKPYSCNLCKSHFARKSSLRVHYLCHSGVKNYACSYCTLTFSTHSGRKRHELTHTKDKAFTCEHCRNKFATPEGLKLHVRTHTGEKPYVCEYCEVGFAQSSNLKYHILVNHSEPEDKKYVCEYCEKRFVRSCEYGRHILTHTSLKPFKCDKCNMAFNRSDKLKYHMFKHQEGIDDVQDQVGSNDGKLILKSRENSSDQELPMSDMEENSSEVETSEISKKDMILPDSLFTVPPL